MTFHFNKKRFEKSLIANGLRLDKELGIYNAAGLDIAWVIANNMAYKDSVILSDERKLLKTLWERETLAAQLSGEQYKKLNDNGIEVEAVRGGNPRLRLKRQGQILVTTFPLTEDKEPIWKTHCSDGDIVFLTDVLGLVKKHNAHDDVVEAQSYIEQFVHCRRKEVLLPDADSSALEARINARINAWQSHNPLTDEYDCDEPEYPTQREKIKQLNKQLKPLGYYARNNGTSTESIGIRSRDGGWQNYTRKIATLFKNAPMNWLKEATDSDKEKLTTILTNGEDIMSPQDKVQAAQETGTAAAVASSPLRMESVTYLGGVDIQDWSEEDFIQAVAQLNKEKKTLVETMGDVKSKKVTAKIEEIENTIKTIVELLDGE